MSKYKKVKMMIEVQVSVLDGEELSVGQLHSMEIKLRKGVKDAFRVARLRLSGVKIKTSYAEITQSEFNEIQRANAEAMGA